MSEFGNFINILIMKLKGFYRRVFNTRLKRLAVNSCAAFCVGAAVTFGACLATEKMWPGRGVGGLETPGVPRFVESDSGRTVDFAAMPDTVASYGDSESDSLDAAAAVLESDASAPVGDTELCYYPYRVKAGDMIGYIADTFNVTQDTIISVNDVRQSRLLQIGQYLKIPSMPGILYTVKTDGETAQSISEKYEVSAEKLARVNSIRQDARLTAGRTVFVPDAQLDWVTRQEINGDLFRRPLRGRYWISSYYGWRSSPFSGKRTFHSGIDMASPQGTNVFAALGGTVSSVGYNNVYGNYIIITHHSGYKTLYGHLSATLVSRGQYVTADTRIGKVGSTGMSTGPHLHFTVFKFGKTVNPAGLWK